MASDIQTTDRGEAGLACKSQDLVAAYWERYRQGWHDSSVDLFALRDQVRASLRFRPNDLGLRMLLGSLDRDLD